MSRVKDFIRKYLSFNSSERKGLIALLSIIFILTSVLIWQKSQRSPLSISFEPVALAKNDKTVNETAIERKTEKTEKEQSSLFVFDPNTISEEQAAQLGFSPKLIKTFFNFRSKGAKFKTAEDFRKVYGVSESFFKKLEPYILIESGKSGANEHVSSAPPNRPAKALLDINTADSVQLVQLKGIGPALSRRILIYRNMLGGFVSTDQLKEVYGLKDTLLSLVLTQVYVNPALAKKININTITLDLLKKHAYLKFAQANSVINYRDKHGKYKNTDDLKNVGCLTDEQIKRLEPYLEF